jgi:ribosomal protein S8E
MAKNASFIQPSTLDPAQGRKRHSTVGKREEREPRKRSKLSGDNQQRSMAVKDLGADSDAPVETVRTSIDPEDDAIDISSALCYVKLDRQEREQRLRGEDRRVRRERCRWCDAWISTENKLKCKICGRDPQPTCSCGAPAVNGANCEDCRKTSCLEWIRRD